MLGDVAKIFIPTALTFFLGLFLTPVATHFFYKYRMWKKFSRNGHVEAADFVKIHNEKEELHTPRVGGMIIWVSVFIVAITVFFISLISSSGIWDKASFLSRNQTLIPFYTLILGSLIGLWDDLIQIYGNGKFAHDDSAWRKWKVLMVGGVSLLIGMWFYYKLGMTSVEIPFGGELFLGSLIIPFFIFVSLATFSGGVIDGIDGLSGGVFAIMFGAFSVIAFANNQIDIAAFSGAITGGILAFLWFNIPPARFYMGETGIMGLTVTLSTIAFLTDSVFILPIVAMPLVITSLSVILQYLSKKFRGGKRLFKVAPIHHHFEALGWPSYKVTMRFWILSIVFAIIGIIIVLIER
jgi:phospho-N-acetylmuramoyl-pentapeptide-transferase